MQTELTCGHTIETDETADTYRCPDCSKKAKKRIERAAAPTPDPIPEPEPVVAPAAAADFVVLHDDRVARFAAARAEHALLAEWIKNGENPPRPATPNLDAIQAEHAPGAPRKAAKARKATSDAGRGPKVSDADLVARVRAVLEAKPTATVHGVYQTLGSAGYWVPWRRISAAYFTIKPESRPASWVWAEQAPKWSLKPESEVPMSQAC